MISQQNQTNRQKPQLSIGLPVYNGEQFLEQALDAILAQTYQDFELIISDNASTDRTEEICQTYAAKDLRLRYYRNSQNLGAASNFNRVFQLATGKYFKWTAHDDLYAPDFLVKCIEVLEKDPLVVLCHSQVKIIDREGEFLQNYELKLRTDAAKPHERFHDLLRKHLCYQIFGVIRVSTLKQTSLIGNYGHADGVLLSKLALLGRFHEIPQHLFFARNHPQQSMSLYFPTYLSLAKQDASSSIKNIPDHYSYTVWFDPAKKGKIFFPHWRIFCEYWLSVQRSSLSWWKKIRCYLSIFLQLGGMEYLLLQDLIRAKDQYLKHWRNYSLGRNRK
jgi:glycosyltransferase involved in cell wall biosynthesis